MRMLTAASVAVLALMAGGAVQAEDKIGFIYVGPSADYGYNMSMDLGRLYVEEQFDDVSTTAFEEVPESAEVERVIERLINSGHNIIFATSYGYLDHAITVGEKYPDVSILHAGGLKTSANVGTYWADSDDGMYLAGMVAGHVSESGQLGFIGAFQIPQLFRSINAFTLGAQSINPDATTTVVWTGGWWEPQKEAEATNAFGDQGIDVIAEQVDSPITIGETAVKRGVHIIGKDVDISDRVPEAWLTGVSWNWGPMMVDMVEEIRAGSWEPGHVRGDLASGHAVLDPFGAAVPEPVQAEVLAVKEAILAGEKDVFTGPIYRQDGSVAVPEGATMTLEEIETMDFLVQGVIGSTS